MALEGCQHLGGGVGEGAHTFVSTGLMGEGGMKEPQCISKLLGGWGGPCCLSPLVPTPTCIFKSIIILSENKFFILNT